MTDHVPTKHSEAVTTIEAAGLLGVHLSTIRRIPASELPFYRIGSRGDRRYRRADVQAYIERRTER